MKMSKTDTVPAIVVLGLMGKMYLQESFRTYCGKCYDEGGKRTVGDDRSVCCLRLAVLGFLLGSDDSYIDTLIVKDEKELITDKRKKREGIEVCGKYSGQRRQLFCFRMLSRTHSVPWNCQFCHKSKRYHQEVASEFCYIPSTPSSTSPGNKWKMVWRWKGERD